ncbi:hypothetical protein D3C72_1038220 [compost metagenome]
MAQQVVQVQVFLPQAPGVHVRHCGERLAQHQVLLVGQYRQALHCRPGIGQAFGAVEEFEQQPAALAFLEAVGQQLGRGQALLGQQLHALQFALEMSCSVTTDQQLGQHRGTAPHAGAHIALARQHAQQAEQLQVGRAGGIGQGDAQGQRGAAPGLFQFRQTHQRASFSRRRCVRRCSQVSTSVPSAGRAR